MIGMEFASALAATGPGTELTGAVGYLLLGVVGLALAAWGVHGILFGGKSRSWPRLVVGLAGVVLLVVALIRYFNLVT